MESNSQKSWLDMFSIRSKNQCIIDPYEFFHIEQSNPTIYQAKSLSPDPLEPKKRLS